MNAKQAKGESGDVSRRQYEAWGLVVQTSRVRSVHVANGIMQLLRLLPEPPPFDAAALKPADYVKLVTSQLHPSLGDAARALCVNTTAKRGPVDLFARGDEEVFVRGGREHLARVVEDAERVITPDTHRALVDILNADRAVFASGGSDPTTTGLAFAGYTPTHTLKGMHAATYLGLLAATSLGREALAQLYRLARDDTDPHSQLIRLLQLNTEGEWPSRIEPARLEQTYPLPPGARWQSEAVTAGRLAINILQRSERGVSKAESLMAIVDLALLQLSLLLLRWEPDSEGPARQLILAVSARQGGRSLQHGLLRSQESFRRAREGVEEKARLVSLVRQGDNVKYGPAVQATNLATAGGWLYPTERRGGSPQYLSPGPRQLVTLVHAVVTPGEELPWALFAERVEAMVGLALGGARDSSATEQGLSLGSVAEALREVARANQEQALHLGLARRESDNVVIVDGGGAQ